MKTNEEIMETYSTEFIIENAGVKIEVRRFEEYTKVDDVQYTLYYQNPVNENWYETIEDCIKAGVNRDDRAEWKLTAEVINTNAKRYDLRIQQAMEEAEDGDTIHRDNYVRLSCSISRDNLNLRLLAELIEDHLSFEADTDITGTTGELREELKKINVLINGGE